MVADCNAVSMLACYVHGNGDDDINTNFSPFCYNSISIARVAQLVSASDF